MSEFSLCTVDDARAMLRWLARRRRTSLTGLVRAANRPSNALVAFATENEASQRTRDTDTVALIEVVNAQDHVLIARPCGGKHLQVSHPGAVPLEIRGAGGGLLEVPLESLEDIRVLGRTMVAATGQSLTSLAYKAGIGNTMVNLTNGSADARGIGLRIVLEMALAGGFELVVQPRFANRREARLADKLGTTL